MSEHQRCDAVRKDKESRSMKNFRISSRRSLSDEETSKHTLKATHKKTNTKLITHSIAESVGIFTGSAY